VETAEIQHLALLHQMVAVADLLVAIMMQELVALVAAEILETMARQEIRHLLRHLKVITVVGQ
jgi:hypothetical protein